jgi:SAM-dependent methyltransferase
LIHSDHVRLLRPANLPSGGTWADFGAGSGAFTLALRELVGPGAEIYAIDKDGGSLRELERAYQDRFGETAHLHMLPADFTRPVELPSLDGALMANSLHYVRDADDARRSANQPKSPAPHSSDRYEGKLALLSHMHSLLKPGGTFLLVEYNADSGNMWVPYPLSFQTWRGLAPHAGFSEPRLLRTHPSRFLHELYSAICYRQEG